MKITRLIIDDRRIEREPRDDTVICKTAEEALKRLQRGDFDAGIQVLMLDHDLGVNERGEKIIVMPFVKELEWRCGINEGIIPIDTVYIHTSNPSGKAAIYAAFTNNAMRPHYPRVERVTDTEIGLYDPNDDA